MSPGRSGTWLPRLTAHDPGREALRLQDRVVGYGALSRAARRAAEALDATGLAPGDLVAVLAPPSLEGVALFHALLDRGVVLLPLNARLVESEQRAVLDATGAVALVVDARVAADATRGRRLCAGASRALLGLAPEAPEAPEASAEAPLGVSLETLAPAPGGSQAAAGATAARGDRDDDAARRRAARLAEGAAVVLMTSGTSGRPKGAVLGLDNLVASAEASARLLGSGGADVWLLCMPLFHVGGLSILVRSALVGARVVLQPAFDAGRVAEALDSEGVTRTSLVATMLARLLEARGERRAPEALDLVLLGGGPAPDTLIERARGLGYPIAPTYGLTEAASQVATRPPSASAEEPAGGLVPLPGVALRIVDDAGRPQPAGAEGGIEVRGPIVMRGYLDDPAATRAALRGGWLVTGDVGRLDARGRLRVLDRRADLIVSGGENVYPAELESLLAEHPDVEEAGVFGLPDATWGARPAALVVPCPGARLDPAALAAHCRARLAGYKQPVGFAAVEALPRTATGKLQRKALAELWAQAAGGTTRADGRAQSS